MDDMEETIALRRSIGTDSDSLGPLNKEIDNEVKMVSLDNEIQVKTENVHSQTIFLYGISSFLLHTFQTLSTYIFTQLFLLRYQ